MNALLPKNQNCSSESAGCSCSACGSGHCGTAWLRIHGLTGLREAQARCGPEKPAWVQSAPRPLGAGEAAGELAGPLLCRKMGRAQASNAEHGEIPGSNCMTCFFGEVGLSARSLDLYNVPCCILLPNLFQRKRLLLHT